MTDKEKLSELLNLYGLKMVIHKGEVTFYDIETGMQLETYYVVNERKEDEVKVKTSKVKELFEVKNRSFYARAITPKLEILCELEIDKYNPIYIRRNMIRKDEEGKAIEYKGSSIRKDTIFDIGIYDLTEEVEGRHIRFKVKDNNKTKGIYVTDRHYDEKPFVFNRGSVGFKRDDDNSKKFVFDGELYETDNLLLSETIEIIETHPCVKEVVKLLYPDLYSLYERTREANIIIEEELKKYGIPIVKSTPEQCKVYNKIRKYLKNEKTNNN